MSSEPPPASRRLVSRLQRRLSQAWLRAPGPVTKLVCPVRRATDGFVLDRRLQFMLETAERVPFTPSYELPLAVARRRFEEDMIVGERPTDEPPGTDFEIPGLDGAPLRLRVYRPRCSRASARERTAAPALVLLHGGGFVFGSLESHDLLARRLAGALRFPVIAVDYRLAPEHPFPAAVEDSIHAFGWIHDHAGDLGLDPTRIAIGGDSAGANLATVTAWLLRHERPRRPAAQLLLYPILDMLGTSPSRERFAEGYFLDRPLVDWFCAQYFASGGDPLDPRVSPFLVEDLSDSPAAVVATAGFDPLRDEGDIYAERLRAAGVPVRHRCHGGLLHGFAQMTFAPAAFRALVQSARDLRALLGPDELTRDAEALAP